MALNFSSTTIPKRKHELWFLKLHCIAADLGFRTSQTAVRASTPPGWVTAGPGSWTWHKTAHVLCEVDKTEVWKTQESIRSWSHPSQGFLKHRETQEWCWWTVKVFSHPWSGGTLLKHFSSKAGSSTGNRNLQQQQNSISACTPNQRQVTGVVLWKSVLLEADQIHLQKELNLQFAGSLHSNKGVLQPSDCQGRPQFPGSSSWIHSLKKQGRSEKSETGNRQLLFSTPPRTPSQTFS